MAFLDNSGDIILDAVLTDTGRLRLAQGDGSFKISKFAIGDDELGTRFFFSTAMIFFVTGTSANSGTASGTTQNDVSMVWYGNGLTIVF